MASRKLYRLSGPAVLIGYILLIPSILGILGGGACVALSVMGGVAGVASATDSQGAQGKSEQEMAREALFKSGVPPNLADRVMAGEPLSAEEQRALPHAAALEVVQASLRLKSTDKNEYLEEQKVLAAAGATGAVAGSVLGAGIGLVFVVGSLVSGLLGYLLIMKKRVLQCMSCGATVAAS